MFMTNSEIDKGSSMEATQESISRKALDTGAVGSLYLLRKGILTHATTQTHFENILLQEPDQKQKTDFA